MIQMQYSQSRRSFLSSAAGCALSPLVLLGDAHTSFAEEDNQNCWVVARRLFRAGQITTGPKHHWFGYYDKQQFDETNRFVLSNEVGFEHRTPRADDVIHVGVIDLEENDRWNQLGSSSAWGWQQGCMLQWRPQHANQLFWNDRHKDRFVCRLLNHATGERNTIDRPLYAVSPDGKWGISADFARIQNMRPGYGYQGIADPVGDETAPEKSGIWKVDLTTGESKLIVSLAQVAQIPHQGEEISEHWNYFNHLLVNTDGSRITFLHRWRKDNGGSPTGGFMTRMFTCTPDGDDLYILDPSGWTSHFIWRGPDQICAWTKPVGERAAFYLMHDKTQKRDVVGQGVMTLNGHNTYLPQQKWDWILNDTYPSRKERWQTPYLYQVSTGRRVPLGNFHLPAKYKGEWRCDTHPRSSNDGRLVTIDSPHGGEGRQVWLLDVSEIVGQKEVS